MTTHYHTETLTSMTCGKCGVAFAIPDKMYQEKRDDGGDFYCPNGHSRVFRETTQQKLAREQERRREAEQRTRAARDLLAAEERSHAATRGHLTRTKKRIGNGVCPCCNRHFTNVERHMESKHPEYVVGLG